MKAFVPQQTFAICEATGGYEALLLKGLCDAQIPVHRADAVKVKNYIRSLGILGKTDTIDAHALADYAFERFERLALWQATEEERDKLQTLVLHRMDLVKLKGAENSRLKGPKSLPVKRLLIKHIQFIQRQIKQLDDQINTLIATHQTLKKSIKVITSIPGLGQVSAAGICALMPELGHMTRRQAAALAGLAPHPCESGNFRGKRRIKGGRTEVRRLLFMCALVAMRHHPTLREFYNKLILKGKRPIVALTALMRKLIVIINAKLRDEVFAKES